MNGIYTYGTTAQAWLHTWQYTQTPVISLHTQIHKLGHAEEQMPGLGEKNGVGSLIKGSDSLVSNYEC